MLDLMLDVNFTDITLVEARGNYKNVKLIFDKEPFGGDNWMLESNVSVLWQTEPEAPFPMAGFFEAKIHAYENGDMVLVSCILPSGMSRDIEVFSAWAQANHWNRPRLSDDIAKNKSLFWKTYWDTFLLDCNLFDKKFGKREESLIDSDNNISEN